MFVRDVNGKLNVIWSAEITPYCSGLYGSPVVGARVDQLAHIR
jgi:hypothetical protein